ncbi:serine/threonine-protein kinase 3-like [Hordeum vulgare]|nr:serine/threonine-protein kinase 3-like [Hordeum vulgare]
MAEDAAAGTSGRRRLTRVRTLGRGASGAVVSLFAAGDGDELLAVKSAAAASGGAAQLRREGGILASLCSPYVLPCLGSRAAAGGEYQLFLEFAPGGSLADEVERNGGCLEEGAVRAYAADVARGLAYLHGESMVHGDVKGRNVVIGADGWAKLADFGCARSVGSAGPIGGTPAFMAPEVARGEEQGPAADVWALGCTVIEMATGRAPWSHMDDVVAAVRLIGYTDAVPEAPERLSSEAKDFLDKCFRRCAGERWTAEQLLEHPFLAFAGCGADVESAELKGKWVSPKSTLDAAMWESDADEDEKVPDDDTAKRMKALAASYSVLPDWESEDGWIDVLSCQSELPHSPAAEPCCSEAPDSPATAPAEQAMSSGYFWDDERLEAELGVEEAGVIGAAVLMAAAPPDETAYDYVEGFRDEGSSAVLEAELDAEAFDAGGGEVAAHNVGVANQVPVVNQQDVHWWDWIACDQAVVSVDRYQTSAYTTESAERMSRTYGELQHGIAPAVEQQLERNHQCALLVDPPERTKGMKTTASHNLIRFHCRQLRNPIQPHHIYPMDRAARVPQTGSNSEREKGPVIPWRPLAIADKCGKQQRYYVCEPPIGSIAVRKQLVWPAFASVSSKWQAGATVQLGSRTRRSGSSSSSSSQPRLLAGKHHRLGIRCSWLLSMTLVQIPSGYSAKVDVGA